MSGNVCVLGRSTLADVRARAWPVAVLPWGATEAHNTHLPYGTDTIEAEAAAERAATLAAERGADVLVLPALPFGVQTGQMDVPFCINMNPTTQLAVLGDVAGSLERHGVRFLVILNAHGGNEFRSIIRELQPRTSIFLCVVNWWQAADAKQYFPEPGDHAGELETSVMLHVAGELVRPLDQAGPGAAKQFRIPALRSGWAWAPRDWTSVTEDTGVGDPRGASAVKGAAFLDAATAAVAELIVGLSSADPEDMYE